MNKIISWVASIGADPNDDDDLRLRKSLLVVCAFPFVFAGAAWGLMYILFGEPLSGMIPLSYALISLLSIIRFGLTSRYIFFRFSQLMLILLLPFFLMVTLGGFVSGSAVTLWALICPLGSLLFEEPSRAPRWFLAFVVLVILSVFLQSYAGFSNNLTSEKVILFFVINLIGVGSIVFLMVFYFVGQKNIFQEKIRKAYNQLKTTQAQLIQSEKMASLGQLTAGIAHEIKNPLNFVNNFAGLSHELFGELQEVIGDNEEVEPLLEEIKQNVIRIEEYGKRADSIVHSMMQHASCGSGVRSLTDINQLVSEHIDLAYHSTRAQVSDLKITVEKEMGEDAGEVEIVPQEIGRVLVNLFNNAFDAMIEQKAKLNGQYKARLTVGTEKKGDWIVIRISDNGPGILQDVRDKIFEPFFTTKPTGSGTGLGLSMSYDMITQGHGGRLELENGDAEGATFAISLPAKGGGNVII